VSEVVLDNEAVQALTDPSHAKHRRVLAHLQAVVDRRRKGRLVTVAVPTAVRVEAGWDRRAPRSAPVNRFPVVDRALDGGQADVAARIHADVRVGVADAHLGAAIRALPPDAHVVVLTSDPGDVGAATAPRSVTTVLI
jgi:hypothetical protein